VGGGLRPHFFVPVKTRLLDPVRALLLTTCTPDDTKVPACARSIHAAGGVVDVAGDRFFGQAYWSRAIRNRIRLPHPRAGAAYVDEINRLAPSYGWNVLLPLNDYTMHAVVTNRNRLAPALRAALPGPEAWHVSRDKLRITELANRIGVAAPLTFRPQDEQEAVEAARATGYPCVVKLRRGCGAVGRRYVSSEAELKAIFREGRKPSDTVFDFEQLLVQQWIDGEPRDACAIFAHGEPRSVYVQKKLRTWPVDGGRATIVETIEDPAVREAGLAIMRALRWHGPIQTEFRVERRTGKPYLLDINGRTWAAIALSVAAGLDFPAMYCRLAFTGDLEPSYDYRTGVRYRWPFPFTLLSLARSQDRFQVLKDFLLPAPNTYSDWRWDDPGPALAELLLAALRAGRLFGHAPGP
jgi:predicted ATP-grasp superfamily ATP-dependent carboligase